LFFVFLFSFFFFLSFFLFSFLFYSSFFMLLWTFKKHSTFYSSLKWLLALEHRSGGIYGCYRSTKSLYSFINLLKFSGHPPCRNSAWSRLHCWVPPYIMSWNLAKKIFRKFVVKIIHTQFGLWSRTWSQRDVLGLGWMPSEICAISNVEIHNAWIKMASMKKIHKGMTSFLVSYHRNQS
jgi:hypothetical protein